MLFIPNKGNAFVLKMNHYHIKSLYLFARIQDAVRQCQTKYFVFYLPLYSPFAIFVCTNIGCGSAMQSKILRIFLAAALTFRYICKLNTDKLYFKTMKVNGQIQLYPMLRVVLFFAFGIILGVELSGHIPLSLWFVAFVSSLVLAVAAKGYGIAQTVMLFTACLCSGGCLAEHELSSVRIDVPDGEVCYEAVVVSPLEESGKVMRCDLLVTNWPRPVKIRASIFKDARAEQLKPGCGLRVRSKLEKPASFAGSTFDYGRYLLFHGYSFTTFLYVDDWSEDVVSFERLSLVERSKIKALQLRGKLLDNFKKLGIDGQDYAVLAAMTLGERVSMSDDMTDDYSVSGALHILSLSGMHLGIIYAMLLLLFFKRRSSVIVQVFIVTAVWAYVFIAGLPVSAVRSAVMLSVCSFVNLLNRDKISLNVLAVAAFSVLVVNPLNLYDVGFQMSFMSVMFIIVFYPVFYYAMPQRIRNIRVVNYIWQMTAVSLSAQLGVAPLVALYFGRFSCYFLLANFAVIPLSAVILYGVAFIMLFAWQPWLQGTLSAIVVKAVELMNASVSFVASLPGASIDGINTNSVQVLMLYILMFSIYFLLPYLRKLWAYR